jgi:hypothetical protein
MASFSGLFMLFAGWLLWIAGSVLADSLGGLAWQYASPVRVRRNQNARKQSGVAPFFIAGRA